MKKAKMFAIFWYIVSIACSLTAVLKFFSVESDGGWLWLMFGGLALVVGSLIKKKAKKNEK